MSRPLAAGLFLLLCGPISGQQRFEVASIHSSKFKCMGRWDFEAAHGAVNAQNAPMLRIISRAYGLTDDRVSGPSWLDSQCYDVKAKAPGGASERDLMPMLVELLKDRFHLVARRVPDQRPFLRLVIDRNGSKLIDYDQAPPLNPTAQDGRLVFMARHMPDLCERLGKVTGRPVVDKTGLTRDYMIMLSYLPLTVPEGADGTSDIFTAVRDQLGLRLEQERGMVEIVKVDSIQKAPSRN